jgi:hypothetical protein
VWTWDGILASTARLPTDGRPTCRQLQWTLRLVGQGAQDVASTRAGRLGSVGDGPGHGAVNESSSPAEAGLLRTADEAPWTGAPPAQFRGVTGS